MVEKQVVLFQVGKEEYAVPKANIKEVFPCQITTEIPNAPDYMKGIINARGQVIPAVNLSVKFEMTGERTTKSQVMVTEIGSREMGIIVDKVTEELRLPIAAITPTPGAFSERGSYVEGIGKSGNRLVVLLSIANILFELSLKEVV